MHSSTSEYELDSNSSDDSLEDLTVSSIVSVDVSPLSDNNNHSSSDCSLVPLFKVDAHGSNSIVLVCNANDDKFSYIIVGDNLDHNVIPRYVTETFH